ncbi:Fatty acyl-CoA reductase [Durusdinium trenchii]|uniref:Fatty acyl-CoA reductase n=1 Tax=Durusdinium trenchii TaxID=1381693 RepID=A0ABP0R472_9DINO
MSLEEQFERACEHFATIANSSTQKQQLRMYALWNQVKNGDVDVSKAPSSMNVVKHAKFMARKKVIGIPADVAMKRYISELRAIDPDWEMDGDMDKADSLTNPAGKAGKAASKLFKRVSRSSNNKMFRGPKGKASKAIQDEFVKAADYVRHSKLFSDSNSRSLLYSYYKQATEGPCKVPAPRGFSRVRYARWRAWANLFDMPKEEAMQKYVEHVRRFAPNFADGVRDDELAAADDSFEESFEGDGPKQFDGSVDDVTAKSVEEFMVSAASAGGLVYVMTGASGFLGTHLIGELLKRNPDSVIFCLTRATSRARLLAKVTSRFGEGAVGRVVPVSANIGDKMMGMEKAIYNAFANSKAGVDHFFHLAASYDMNASDEVNEKANVDGTMHAIDFANLLSKKSGTMFQYTSSIVVAGKYNGIFFENQLNEGQDFDNPYARTKFQAEMLVRKNCKAAYRVHRPGIVVGSSKTGEAEKIDGPYYFFKPLQHLRKICPSAITLPCVEGGSQPIVPVDYVVEAMDAIAHNPDPSLNGKAFHLVDPSPNTFIEVINILSKAAHAPGFSSSLATFAQALVPPRFFNAVNNIPIVANGPHFIAKNVFDIPESVVNYVYFETDYDDSETREALEGTGIRCPPFKSYAWKLWDYFERHMDPRLEKSKALRNKVQGKVVMVTGASDGIGLTLSKRLARAGAHVILVARSQDKLLSAKQEIEARGGSAATFSADLSKADSTYKMVDAVIKKYGAIDVLVNNAGRSIRRSVLYSSGRDRFHDYERTMTLNYFGGLRVTLGMLTPMRERKEGHIVNISSVGCLTFAPRFGAYVASKAAMDAFSQVISAEIAPENVKISTVYMPLVQTKMVQSKGNKYDHMHLLTTEQASQMIERAIVTQERTIMTDTGRWVRIGHFLAPSLTQSILTLYYQMEPEAPPNGVEPSPAAAGDVAQLKAFQRLMGGAM